MTFIHKFNDSQLSLISTTLYSFNNKYTFTDFSLQDTSKMLASIWKIYSNIKINLKGMSFCYQHCFHTFKWKCKVEHNIEAKARL